jgi:hypothetical protein
LAKSNLNHKVLVARPGFAEQITTVLITGTSSMDLAGREPKRATGVRCHGLACLAAMLALAWTGCDGGGPRVQEIPKEPASGSASAAGPSAAMGANPHGDMGVRPQARWTAPAGWKEETPSQMRLASFSIEGDNGMQATVAVIPMAGMTSQQNEVVNLWREQLKLEPLGTAAIAALGEGVAVGPEKGTLFDLVSKEPLIEGKFKARTLVAMLARQGTGWFFKMTGAETLVDQQKAPFTEFLKSIQFDVGPAAGAMAAAAAAAPGSAPMAGPMGAPMGGGMAMPAADPGAKPAWTVPAGWSELPTPPPMALTGFSVGTGGGTPATLSVTVLAGTGGGVLANVNRWRKQLGLAELDEAGWAGAKREIDTGTDKALIADMSGTNARTGQPARMLGAIVPHGARTWFYKLVGPDAVVGAERERFEAFLKSVKYSE